MDKEKFLLDMDSISKRIDEVAIPFYQNSPQTAYQYVQPVLNEIISFLSQVGQNNLNAVENLNQILLCMMSALEEGDGVLFADMLLYELKEGLRELEYTS